MEIEGHPTQDLIDELVVRGAIALDGSSAGPRVDGIRFLTERLGETGGSWLFLPHEAFLTGFDEPP
jgi:hypothetical protein